MTGALITLLVLVSGIVCALSLARVRTARRDVATLRSFAEKLLKVQEKERKRIAGELHSNVGQNLIIIKNCADLGLQPAANAGAEKQQLQEISKLCAQTIAESRQLAHNLGPRHLEQIGLTEAVDAMVDRVAASTGIRFDRKLESVDGVFDPDQATNVYRIAQEALNNLMKHAHASSVRVELLRDLREVQLIVQDNGRGFDARRLKGQRDGGFGLAEIAERTRILGGRFELTSRPAAGTRVMVTIPIPERSRPGIGQERPAQCRNSCGRRLFLPLVSFVARGFRAQSGGREQKEFREWSCQDTDR